MPVHHLLLADGPGWIVIVGIIGCVAALARLGKKPVHGSGSRDHYEGFDRRKKD